MTGRPRFAENGSIAFVAAASLSLYLVLTLLLVWRFPPFIDEGSYASWTYNVERSPAARFFPLQMGKEPLLEWLAAIPVRLGVEPLTAVRLVSVVAGAGTVVLVGIVGFWLGGRRVAGVALVLGATCPFLVLYGSLGLYESLATFLVFATLVLGVVVARTLRLDAALGLGIALGLALLTKESTTLALLLWPLSLLCFDWSRHGRRRRLYRWLAVSGLAALVAAAIESLLWMNEFHDDLVRGRADYPVHSIRDALSHPFDWLRVNDELLGVVVDYLTPVVFAAALCGMVVGLRRNLSITGVVATWAFVPLAAGLLLPDIPFPRYVHAVAPPLLALAALGVVAVVDRAIRTGFPAWAGAAALAAALVFPLVFLTHMVLDPTGKRYPGLDDFQYVRGWPSGAGWDDVSDQVRARAHLHEGPVVVMLGPRSNDWLNLDLRDEPRIRLVSSESEDAQDALLGIRNDDPLPARPTGLGWRLVETVERPRNGTPLRLYQAGAVLDGRFAATPLELRALLGWDDAAYDQYVEGNPAVKRWVLAYHAAAA